MPRAMHVYYAHKLCMGTNGQLGVWGREPPSLKGFFIGRSPDLWSGFFTINGLSKLLDKHYGDILDEREKDCCD